jgi:hypothetical protein
MQLFQGIVVTRFVDRESNTQSECIAQHMNETEAPSLDPNEYSNGEVYYIPVY